MDFSLLESLNLDPSTVRIFKEILIVLGIGLLVGFEREYSKRKDQEDRVLFAGVRTYPIVALIGYLSYYIGAHSSFVIFVITFGLMFLFVILSYYLNAKGEVRGGTTEFSLIAACIVLNSC